MPAFRALPRNVLSIPKMTSPMGSSLVKIEVAISCPVSPKDSCSTVIPVSEVNMSNRPSETAKESCVMRVTDDSMMSSALFSEFPQAKMERTIVIAGIVRCFFIFLRWHYPDQVLGSTALRIRIQSSQLGRSELPVCQFI